MNRVKTHAREVEQARTETNRHKDHFRLAVACKGGGSHVNGVETHAREAVGARAGWSGSHEDSLQPAVACKGGGRGTDGLTGVVNVVDAGAPPAVVRHNLCEGGQHVAELAGAWGDSPGQCLSLLIVVVICGVVVDVSTWRGRRGVTGVFDVAWRGSSSLTWLGSV